VFLNPNLGNSKPIAVTTNENLTKIAILSVLCQDREIKYFLNFWQKGSSVKKIGKTQKEN
jgi:hypothetical protein